VTQAAQGDERNWFERARDFFTVELWSVEHSRNQIVRLLQFCIMVGEGFVRDHLLLRASALTYFTVLSVIPILAVAVSIASAVGVGGESFVTWVLSTVTAGSPEARQSIRSLIENANFAGLGTLGAVVLFVTTVLAIGNVETTLNSIWGVPRARSWARRFPDYLAVLVVAPLLAGAALSLAPTIKNEWVLEQLLQIPAFQTLFQFGVIQIPTLMLTIAFSFLYWFMPNTRVRVLSALVGGIPAALLTVIAQNVYVDFSIGVARANAFFGSFAALPLLFLWIYVVWAIFLLGAELGFAHQNLQRYRREVRGARAGPAEREAVGLRIALEVARCFRDAAPAPDADGLADALDLPVRTVRDVASSLEGAGMLSTRVDDEENRGYQLGRPAESVLLIDLLRVLRGEREPAHGDPRVASLVEGVLAELEEGAARGAGGRTLADLLSAVPPAPEVATAPAPVDPPETGG
jgi:membrane protein